MRVPLLLLASFYSCLVFGQKNLAFQEVKTEADWDAIVETARVEDKLIFAEAYATWCGYCKQMDREVFTNPEVIDLFNQQFINVKFDGEKGYGIVLNERLKVEGFPAMFFLNKEMESIQTISGYVPSPTLLAYANQAINVNSKLPLLKDKYENGTITDDEKLELIGVLESVDHEKAAPLAKEYLSTLTLQNYIDQVENLWLASRFENQLTTPNYLLISANKDALVEAHGLEEYQDYFKAIFNDNLQLAVRYGNQKLLYQLITDVLPQFLPEIELPEAAFITKKIYFQERQEFDKYQFEVKSYLNNTVVGDDTRLEFLFNNALEIIEGQEDEAMIQFAADLLTQAVALDPTHFESTSLLGYNKALLGDFDEALNLLEKAKGLTESQEEKDMADGMIQAVKAMKEM